ncbi:MAG: glycosyltransferase family 2 protein, partial [bacterium]|nr:glycosyltransferase family 2 protein [bacterium]
MTLSIIVPCYNEAGTLGEVLRRVLAVDLGAVQKEILVVDDGSTDGSVAIVAAVARQYPAAVSIHRLPRNRGTAAAVRQGIALARGDLVVIQDADLEYDPEDFRRMVPLFQRPSVDAVFGSRRLAENPVSGTFYFWGAQCINLVTNLLYGARLTDQFTCYKMVRRNVLQQIPLRAERFAVDAELTAKLLRRRAVIREVPKGASFGLYNYHETNAAFFYTDRS